MCAEGSGGPDAGVRVFEDTRVAPLKSDGCCIAESSSKLLLLVDREKARAVVDDFIKLNSLALVG